MDDFKQRMRAEFKDLDEKITRLRQFLGTDTFDNLDSLNQSLLIHQLKAMQEYQFILELRIGKI